MTILGQDNLESSCLRVRPEFVGGFTAMLLRFPDERVTVLILRNYGIPVYDRLEIELAKMVFAKG